MASRTVVAATALILAGIGSASAQTFVVDDAYGSYGSPAYGSYGPPAYGSYGPPAYGSYGPPAYGSYGSYGPPRPPGLIPGGPVYPAQVVVVPRVYVIPQPLYAAPPIAPPYWGGGGGVVIAPRPGWTTGVAYPGW